MEYPPKADLLSRIGRSAKKSQTKPYHLEGQSPQVMPQGHRAIAATSYRCESEGCTNGKKAS